MGNRVHVIKKHAEYGSTEAFNWQSQDFRSLLNMIQPNTVSGEDYSDNFELPVEDYKQAIKLMGRVVRYQKHPDNDKFGDFRKLTAMLDELGESYGDLCDRLDNVGGAEYVLNAMVGFYSERDRSSDWISFSAW